MNDSAVQKKVVPQNTTVDWHDTKSIYSKTACYLEPYSALIWIHEFASDDIDDSQFSLQFFLSEHSSLIYIPILHGGSCVDLDIQVNLDYNAHAIVAGAYSLKDKQQCTIRTRQQHQGKNAKSSLSFNGIAADQSSVSYYGTIAIEKNACNTNASQENKTIIWGSEARAISIPALEVETNEVQCAHGSAVGPLNAEHIQYVQSRGLSLKEAQRLLLTSFFAETLYTLKEEEFKSRIIASLISHVLDK